MPFSKRNIRFTSMLISAVLTAIVSAISVAAILRAEQPSPALLPIATGLPSVLVMQLLSMMRQEQVRNDTRHDVRNELGPVSADARYTAERLSGGGEGDGSPMLIQISQADLERIVAAVLHVLDTRAAAQDERTRQT